jgi:hypothetical protein
MDYPAIIPDEGSVMFADIITAYIQGGSHNAKIHLFSNDLVPVRATVLGDFTDSVAGGMFPQVVAVPVNGGVDAAGKDILLWPQQTWTATGAGLPAIVYGYYVAADDPLTGLQRLMWCQRFQVPQAIIAAGNKIFVQLSLGTKQC